MATVQIEAARVKQVRTARKIGRPKLAKLTGLTERQIAKIEGEAPAKVSVTDGVAVKLAGALQLPVGALIGELQLLEEDLAPIVVHGSGCGCCP